MGFPFACILHIVHFHTCGNESDTAGYSVDCDGHALSRGGCGFRTPGIEPFVTRMGNERLFIAEF